MQINSKISSVVPRARIRGGLPNVRVSSYQTGILTESVAGTTINSGTPIGLLLALTYASNVIVGAVEVVYRGDQRPNVRIRTN